jgi:hypothetical protein
VSDALFTSHAPLAAVCLAEAAWCVSLWRRGLARKYSALMVWLVFSAVQSVTAALLVGLLATSSGDGTALRLYFYVWLSSSILHVGLAFSALVQMYGRTLESYPSLQWVAGWLVKAAWALSGFLVVGLVFFASPETVATIRGFAAYQGRNVFLALIAALLLGSSFASAMRLRRSPDLTIAFAVLGGTFLIQAIELTIHSMGFAPTVPRGLGAWPIAGLFFFAAWRMKPAPEGEGEYAAPRVPAEDFAEQQEAFRRRVKDFDSSIFRVLKP